MFELITQSRYFDGTQGVYKHVSSACGGIPMTFGVYTPPQAATSSVPVLWYLSGLTCTHENAMVKAGMQKYAAHHGIMLVFPDTSPRGSDIPDDESYDLGQGAGFYVDSVEAPWSKHFQMYSYLTKELPQLIAQEFPVDLSRQGITGHSMGGHGALMIALKSSVGTFRSVSAFSPICNPINSPWGQKQFSAYLGNDKELWKEYDASFLIKSKGSYFDSIKIDVGSNDPFLGNLMVNELEKNASGNVQVSVRNGYDHSYFFIASFAEDHIDWHAQRLACKAA